jgi:hypothetical protein
MIATPLDHNGFVTIPVLADHFPIAMIPVTVTTDCPDGDTARTDTYANFFRASRHCDANSGRCDGKYCQTPDHCMLLSLFSLRIIGKVIRPGLNGSGEVDGRRSSSRLHRQPYDHRDEGNDD